jgi:hypothetical protein
MRRRARLTEENNPLTQTDEVLAGLEQFSKSASQQVSKPESQQSSKLTSQKASHLTSQETVKLTIRKATFQLSEEVLQQLDKLHLQLQLQLGKSETPYKEVIVEEAIAQLLEQSNEDLTQHLSAFNKRQQRRNRL